jgi:3-deoxy-D-manno-octulosonate 8-phosphate phosphatase (KDO 8-P phosphatase)
MLEERGAGIKLLLLDVDGVLTDGCVLLNGSDEEFKCFNVRDGLGLKLLQANGVEVALVSGRASASTSRRALELGITEVHQGSYDKGAVCRQFIAERHLVKDEICAVGDDILDLAMFALSGFNFAVADAVEEVRKAADIVLSKPGGHGAVRDVCEWILKCKGSWAPIVAGFSKE